MKEEFSILAENADTKTRRYVDRTRLSALRQGTGADADACDGLHGDGGLCGEFSEALFEAGSGCAGVGAQTLVGAGTGSRELVRLVGENESVFVPPESRPRKNAIQCVAPLALIVGLEFIQRGRPW